MIMFVILAAIATLAFGVSAYRAWEMLHTSAAIVRGETWARSTQPIGYWFWVSLMIFLSLAGAVFSAVCLYVLAFHDFGS